MDRRRTIYSLFRLDGGAPRNLTEKPLDRPIEGHAWRSPDQILAVVDDGFASRLVMVGLDGKTEHVRGVEVNPFGPGGLEQVGRRGVHRPDGDATARSLVAARARPCRTHYQNQR